MLKEESIPGIVYTGGVTVLIAFIAFSSQFFIVIPFLGRWSSQSSLAILVPLNVIIILIYYNYYLAVTTDPGRIPVDWTPPSTLLVPTNNHRRAQGITGPRYCKGCRTYKPPRSHHCKHCNRCVLKMDHHCPWISNCVGHGNYPHFLRFIFYVNAGCLYILTLIGLRIREILNDIRVFKFETEPTTIEAVFLVIDSTLAFVVLVAVGMLSVYQFYCLARNQSTIEAWERSKVERLVKHGKITPVAYPFDIGVYANICSVLGNNPLLWMWPQKHVLGDGISFALRPNTDIEIPYFWPPRDPDELRPSIFSGRYRGQQERLHQSGGLLTDTVPEELSLDESDEYYDSGSFASDSDDDSQQVDEEQGIGRRVGHRILDMTGQHVDHHRRRRDNAKPETEHLLRDHDNDHGNEDEDEDDVDDDHIALSTFFPRKGSKDTKNE